MQKDDLIYRQAAIDKLFELYEYQRDIDPTEAADLVRQGIYLAEKKIEQLPSAEPERKTGKWLSQVGGGYCCSKCGRYALHDVDEKFALLFTKSKYCPHCGAKMKGEDKG